MSEVFPSVCIYKSSKVEMGKHFLKIFPSFNLQGEEEEHFRIFLNFGAKTKKQEAGRILDVSISHVRASLYGRAFMRLIFPHKIEGKLQLEGIRIDSTTCASTYSRSNLNIFCLQPSL